MKNALAFTSLLFMIVSSIGCGISYNYEKVVVNESDSEIMIKVTCCGLDNEYIIPPHEQAVVFRCIYESFKKPACEDVDDGSTTENVPAQSKKQASAGRCSDASRSTKNSAMPGWVTCLVTERAIPKFLSKRVCFDVKTRTYFFDACCRPSK